MLLCCFLQAAEFPAQHLSVEFQEILRLSCFGSRPCILNADANSHLLVQPGSPAKRHIIGAAKLAETHCGRSLEVAGMVQDAYADAFPRVPGHSKQDLLSAQSPIRWRCWARWR